jgi:hypothetical protein
VCRQAGLVRLGRVAIDGTRMKANASKHKAMRDGRMREKEAALEQEIAELLRRAEQVDRDEDTQHGPDRRGDELPAELARRESRLQKIREAKAALETEAREPALRARKDPTQAQPTPKAQRNFTDPESKIQKTADGFIQGYNAQAAVDASAQVIVAHDVTPMAADVGHLVPLVTAIGRTLQQRPRQVLVDTGYCSEENLQTLDEKGIDPYIATGRQTHTEWQAPAPRGRPPATLTRRDRMARNLRTMQGRTVYACRKAIVEPVFGQINRPGASGSFSGAARRRCGRSGRCSVRCTIS